MSAVPWQRTAAGLRLTVRLTPRGGRDALGGVRRDLAGRAQLLARVASPPLDGAANKALIKMVAKALSVPKSAVAITAGKIARIKTLEIAGDPAILEQALKTLI
ncbi:MAG: DUF167 family protein [Alphaproteobacteria bacterium]